MKVIGYVTEGALKLWEAYAAMPGFKVKAQPDARYTVPVALALPPVEGGADFDPDEGWWNDDGNIFTIPVTVGDWGARIEVHGESIEDATAMAQRVLDGLT